MSSSADRMALLDPSAYPGWFAVVWVAAIAAGIGVCAVGPVFRRIEILSTLAHEIGHGLGGLLAGRKFTSFKLHPDASGVTYTSGAGKLGLAFCFWSGYAAPGTVGLLLAAVVAVGAPGWAFMLAAAVMALCLIRVRSALTLLLVVGTGAAAVGVWWLNQPALQTSALLLFSAFFLTAGFRQIHDAWRQRKIDGGEADGDALEGLTKIPEIVWLVLFHVHTAVCTVAAVALTALTVSGMA